MLQLVVALFCSLEGFIQLFVYEDVVFVGLFQCVALFLQPLHLCPHLFQLLVRNRLVLNDLGASLCALNSSGFVLEDADFLYQVTHFIIVGKSGHHALQLISHLPILLYKILISLP